ncbi:unnamed protein product [Rotaria socialis]
MWKLIYGLILFSTVSMTRTDRNKLSDRSYSIESNRTYMIFVPKDVPIGYTQIIDTFDSSFCLRCPTNKTISHQHKLPFEILLLPNDNCTLYLHIIHLFDQTRISKYTIQQNLTRVENITINIQLSVNIVDVNDHVPMFGNEFYHFIVKENVQPGTYIGHVQAYNPFIFSTSKISYILHDTDLKHLNNKTMFRIDKYTGDIFLFDCKLDYETKREHKIMVEARVYDDNETATQIPLSSFVDIIITVEDINDEKLQIIFTMPDDNNNNENSVKIMNISKPQLSEEQNRLISAFRSRINLIENDAELVILSKEEPLPANTLLALLHLRDNDQTSNGTFPLRLQTHVKCSKEEIFNTVTFCRVTNLFHLSIFGPNVYGLFNSRILDREKYENYIIHLTAIKNDSPSAEMNINSNSFHTELFIYLVLLDINDNIPIFNQSYFHIQINENEPKGKFLTHLHAHDNDKGINGTVRYELIVNNRLFSINAYTGILRTKRRLDRELCELYRIGVRAYDLGFPQRKYSSIVLVDVQINNINDHVPYFMHDIYHFYVEENVPIGKIIGRLTIDDKDDQEPIEKIINLSTIDDGDILHFNARRSHAIARRVNYSMINFLFIDSHRNESLSGLFSIDSQGFIHTSAILDREIQSNYTLYVFMYDTMLKSYTAPTYVIIQILDENDNAPYEPFLSNSSILSIQQKKHDETVIYKFKPIDLDDGLNGLVSIECLNCSTLFYFHIVNSSILITRPKLKVPDGIYTLAFALRDHGLITSHEQIYTLTFNLSHRSNINEQEKIFSTNSTHTNFVLVYSWSYFIWFLIIWFILAFIASWRCYHYNRTSTNKRLYRHRILHQREQLSTQICHIIPDLNTLNNHNFSEKEVLGNLNSISIRNHASQVILRSKRFSRSQNINSHYQRSSSMMNSRETILTDAATNTSYHEDNNDIWKPMNNNNNNHRILYENASTILSNKNFYFEPIDRDLSTNAAPPSQINQVHLIQRPVPISNYNLNKIIEHSQEQQQQQQQQSFSQRKRNTTMNFKSSPTDSTMRSCALPRSITTDQFAINKTQTNRLYYYPSVQDVLDALNRHSNFKESIV